jgi:hypothetical protein
MEAIVSLEHGTCLCLVLQLGNPLVSESYQFHVSPYFFIQSKSALIVITLHSWYSSSQCLPSQLSCLIMFKGSFTSNHPSAVFPVSISCVSPYSFDSPSYITFLCQFHVDDGGYIKALLRRVFSCRLQHIILGIRLRNQLVPWDLHASMAGLLTSDSRFTSLTSDRMIP